MKAKHIVFLGDCQAASLGGLYRDFVAHHTNERVSIVGDRGDDEDLRTINSADILVSQVFNFEKKINSSAMRSDAIKIQFPAIFIGFFWPFSGQRPHTKNASTPLLRDGPYAAQIGDIYLNGLIEEGVSAEDALRRYLDLDIARTAHLDRMLELHLDAQRNRDIKTDFQFRKLIEENFRDTSLFLTSSHPDLGLMVPLIRGVFERLDVLGDLTETAIRSLRVSPFPETALPIHPNIIEHFGLRFVNSASRFQYMEEGAFTFDEFVLRYMNYTWNEDLLEGLVQAHSLNPKSALVRLEKGLRQSPRSAAGWRSKSMMLRRLGRPAEAQVAAERAIEIDPDSPATHAELGRVFLESSALARAEEQARKAIAVFRPDAGAHRLLAETLIASGRFDEAVAAAREAISLRPRDPGGFHLLAGILIRQGEFAEAEQLLLDAIAAGMVSEALKEALADALERQGRRAEAIMILRHLISEGTRNAHVHAHLGHCLLRDNDAARAEAAFRAAISIEPLSEFRNMLVEAIERQGRRADAVTILEELVAEGTADPRVYRRLARHQVVARNLDAALVALQTAIALDPPNEEFQNELAKVMSMMSASNTMDDDAPGTRDRLLAALLAR